MKKGFTLIELLVVVAIIGMLSSVVLASLNTARGNARDAKRAQDMQQVVTALELYVNVNGIYPPNDADGGCTGGNAANCLWKLENDLVSNYMPGVPVDPTYNTKSSGSFYLYFTSGDRRRYSLLRWSERLGTWCEPPVPAELNAWSYQACP
tara:strand:+ start:14913 stop:15365 length:453 start_codon:yes stop_codon:yes gene_type:complete